MSHFEARNRYHSQSLAAGGSALLDAINKGKVHLAKFILDAGEYDVVNTKDFKGKTPLIRACYIKEEKTREKMIQLLLSKSANVNLTDDCQRTALSYACEQRCNDVVRILVKNNVEPDIPDRQGNTALIYSATVGNDVAIDILIRSFRRLGLNVDHVNEEGMTALLVAAKGGYIECATILATDGRANVSFRDPQNGMTAEDWARMRGCSSPEVVPLSVNANQRLTRCGSTYVARRATDLSPNVGYSCAAQSNPVNFSQSDVYLKREETTAVEGSGGFESSKGLSTTGNEMNDGKGRPTVLSAVKQRRKRNSLPTIKLWSSLDLPSHRSTSSPVYEESSPLPLLSSSPPLHPHHDATAAAAVVTTAEVVSGHSRPPQQKSSSRNKHRDLQLVRADTEVSASANSSCSSGGISLDAK